MYYIGILVVGAVIGFTAHEPLSKLFKVQESKQEKAICTYFNCAPNAYSYSYDQKSDLFIVTVDNAEYHVQFSQNQPIQVIYAKELEPLVVDG
ncbi:hypothetical protein [Enterococcus sp. 5H]|uniref:hypothetical protein n=1 Tax=Enterococcus sp. 5H TaxID=1229490 RepID=UPI002303BBED|nr:hypothetical protein [Enterococcus sp. 5H]MDA9469898.1 hypothetical protein [Enterococcus sp. 5H]